MLETVVSYAFVTSISLFVIYTVIWNFVHLGHWIKCFKVKTCTSKRCKFNRYCSKWIETYTKEEKEEMLQLIEQYRKKLKKQ